MMSPTRGGGLRRSRTRSGSFPESNASLNLAGMVDNIGKYDVRLHQYTQFNRDMRQAYNEWYTDKMDKYVADCIERDASRKDAGTVIDPEVFRKEFRKEHSILLRSINLVVDDTGRPCLVVARDQFINSRSKKTAAFRMFLEDELGIPAGQLVVVRSGSVQIGERQVDNFNSVRVDMPLEDLLNRFYEWNRGYSPTAEEVAVLEQLQQAFYDDGIGGIAPVDPTKPAYRDSESRFRDQFSGTVHERRSLIAVYDSCLDGKPTGDRPLVFDVRRFTHPSTRSKKTEAIADLARTYGSALKRPEVEVDNNVLIFEGGVTEARAMLARREEILRERAEKERQDFLRVKEEAERLQKQHEEIVAKATGGKWVSRVGASQYCKDVCGPML
jgi:hypothetical protein